MDKSLASDMQPLSVSEAEAPEHKEAEELIEEDHQQTGLAVTTKRSSCTQMDGKKLQYLDRQSVACGPGQALVSFRVVRSGCSGRNMRYEFKCSNVRLTGTATTKRATCTQMDGENLQYLDRQRVVCGSNQALLSFRLIRTGCSKRHMRYEFKCGNLQLGKATTKHIGCSQMDGEKLQYLDRQNVICGANQLMLSFRVVRTGCSGRNMRYQITCAAIAVAAAPPVATGAACKVDKVTNPPYSRCKASSVWNNDKIGVSHGTGRLDSVQAWSARTNAKGQWWQMDLGATKTVGGVRTKGRHGGTDNQRVTAYKVSTSLDGSTWTVVDGDKVFTANVANSNSEIKTRFSKPVTARYVRIIVESWRHHVSMRAAVDVCGSTDYKQKYSERFVTPEQQKGDLKIAELKKRVAKLEAKATAERTKEEAETSTSMKAGASKMACAVLRQPKLGMGKACAGHKITQLKIEVPTPEKVDQNMEIQHGSEVFLLHKETGTFMRPKHGTVGVGGKGVTTGCSFKIYRDKGKGLLHFGDIFSLHSTCAAKSVAWSVGSGVLTAKPAEQESLETEMKLSTAGNDARLVDAQASRRLLAAADANDDDSTHDTDIAGAESSVTARVRWGTGRRRRSARRRRRRSGRRRRHRHHKHHRHHRHNPHKHHRHHRHHRHNPHKHHRHHRHHGLQGVIGNKFYIVNADNQADKAVVKDFAKVNLRATKTRPLVERFVGVDKYGRLLANFHERTEDTKFSIFTVTNPNLKEQKTRPLGKECI